MVMRLEKCPVESLKIGMTIAQDTLVGNGTMVLDAGKKVDQECINMLVKGNIKYVIIEVGSSDPAPPASENRVENKPARPPRPKGEDWISKKKLMFRDCIDDKYMNKLYRIVCDIDDDTDSEE